MTSLLQPSPVPYGLQQPAALLTIDQRPRSVQVGALARQCRRPSCGPRRGRGETSLVGGGPGGVWRGPRGPRAGSEHARCSVLGVGGRLLGGAEAGQEGAPFGVGEEEVALVRVLGVPDPHPGAGGPPPPGPRVPVPLGFDAVLPGPAQTRLAEFGSYHDLSPRSSIALSKNSMDWLAVRLALWASRHIESSRRMSSRSSTKTSEVGVSENPILGSAGSGNSMIWKLPRVAPCIPASKGKIGRAHV